MGMQSIADQLIDITRRSHKRIQMFSTGLAKKTDVRPERRSFEKVAVT